MTPLVIEKRSSRIKATVFPFRAVSLMALIASLTFAVFIWAVNLRMRFPGFPEPTILPALALPVALAIIGLMLYFQRVEIAMDSRALDWKLGPIPYWRTHRVPGAELRSFRLEKSVRDGEHGKRIHYDLMAELCPQGERKIVGGLTKKSALELIETLRAGKTDLIDPRQQGL
jgi:hypothetical protein